MILEISAEWLPNGARPPSSEIVLRSNMDDICNDFTDPSHCGTRVTLTQLVWLHTTTLHASYQVL